MSSARDHVGPKSTGGMSGETTTPANANLGSSKPNVFDAQGAVGKQFTEQGAIGGAAQKIGGPLAKDGAIGHAFTTDGAVGGTVQGALGGNNGGKRSN
ncbi:hypothetical protein P8C59_005022 [Phyllachora maydis]|uniref:Uncharacterized protein n=1 Tax=Phyllachora maydis TaxID=1825666 RepID=A0AAD9I5B3_9PEZI|nr:hypothetical protein P8C59_005022 [Phyllachora maydis]